MLMTEFPWMRAMVNGQSWLLGDGRWEEEATGSAQRLHRSLYKYRGVTWDSVLHLLPWTLRHLE